MKVEHVIWLLRVANNDLPELERKSEVDSLEARKLRLLRHSTVNATWCYDYAKPIATKTDET